MALNEASFIGVLRDIHYSQNPFITEPIKTRQALKTNVARQCRYPWDSSFSHTTIVDNMTDVRVRSLQLMRQMDRVEFGRGEFMQRLDFWMLKRRLASATAAAQNEALIFSRISRTSGVMAGDVHYLNSFGRAIDRTADLGFLLNDLAHAGVKRGTVKGVLRQLGTLRYVEPLAVAAGVLICAGALYRIQQGEKVESVAFDTALDLTSMALPLGAGITFDVFREQAVG